MAAIGEAGITHRAEKDGITAIPQLQEDHLGQGFASGQVVLRTVGQVEEHQAAPPGLGPSQAGPDLGHDFRADPVAGQEGDARGIVQISISRFYGDGATIHPFTETGMRRNWRVGMGIMAMLGLASAAEVREGMKAPAFEAQDQHGAQVRLMDYQGKAKVILYFYPKDDTPGCTAEACSLRDGFATLQAAGAVVLGVSADTGLSHKAFAEKYHLPFSILADPDKRIIEAYGVKMPMVGFAKRVTFLIDRQGIVRKVLTDVQTQEHDRQVLGFLKGMS